MIYEYGIAHWRHDPNGKMEDEQGPLRENMTLDEALEWLDVWQKDGGRKDAFYIIRRPKGAWEAFNGDLDEPLPPTRVVSVNELRDRMIESIRQKAANLPKGPL